jgi:hypothetical protein
MELSKGWLAIGSELLWPGETTYVAVDYTRLPKLERAFDGSFDWLAESWCRHRLIGDESHVSMDRLDALVRQASEQGITVPSSFIKFIGTPALQERVPSPTACWLDLPQRLVQYGDGWLLRFLVDQQVCAVWYLFLRGYEHVVVYVRRSDYTEGLTDSDDNDFTAPAEITVCAESFEAFIYRFWIENVLWWVLTWDHFADNAGKAPPRLTSDQERYWARVRAARTS